MYTLQILDAGQTFLHALDARPTTLGSGDGADVRLQEDGVAAVHVRLVPGADGVRLTAEADVVVNGQTTRAVELRLGDRVEVGGAVLVVGRTVARKAQPDDVLSRSVTRSARRAPAPRSAAPKLVAAVVVLLAIGGAVAASMMSDGGAEAKTLVAMVNDLRARGKLAEAKDESARLRAMWQDAEDDRLVLLDQADAALAAVDASIDALRGEVLDPTIQRTYGQWFQELRGMEERSAPHQQLAARKVRSRLRELIRERDEGIDAAAVAARAARAEAEGAVAAPAEQAPVTPAPRDVAPPSVDLAELDRRCERGQFAQALALIQAGFETAADQAEVARLRQAKADVQLRAERALQALLGEAGKAEAQGRLEHAVTVLQTARHHFPAGARFAALGNELARLDALVLQQEHAAAMATAPSAGSGEVDQATRLQTLASLRSHMDRIRDAEDAWDYARAATLLREGAGAVRARDAEFADRLLVRAEESDLLASWNQAVVAAIQAGKRLTASDTSGRELALLRVERGRVVARSPDGEGDLEWFDVDAAGMLRIGAAIKAGGRTALALAALLYKNGESEAAEGVLADLVRRDADQWQPHADSVLARGRGDDAATTHYELRKGEFVSLREVELEALGKKLLGKLDGALRARDPAARDAFVQATLAEGGLQREALGFAAREAFQQRLERVQRSGLKKQVDELTAERDALDAARDHAKALIFDEVKYFYPYKPPAVSGEKHAEYNRVQQEIDRRIAALRKVWQGSKTRVKVTTKFGDDLDRIDWLAEQLARLGALPKGESVASVLQPAAWARALEPGESVTLQTFCLTPSERAQRAYWRQIRAYNEAAKDEWPVAVTTLLRITNDYRVMFGHRPLAAVASACEGSQGHADEMSRLGYFAHMSPTPGRKTPTDRMRLAGYMFGVSENIALTGGAMSSHVAWCHSSGHHRNLLSPGHREIGIGANGRYWVQNFGSGDVHKSHPLWPTGADK